MIGCIPLLPLIILTLFALHGFNPLLIKRRYYRFFCIVTKFQDHAPGLYAFSGFSDFQCLFVPHCSFSLHFRPLLFVFCPMLCKFVIVFRGWVRYIPGRDDIIVWINHATENISRRDMCYYSIKWISWCIILSHYENSLTKLILYSITKILFICNVWYST